MEFKALTSTDVKVTRAGATSQRKASASSSPSGDQQNHWRPITGATCMGHEVMLGR